MEALVAIKAVREARLAPAELNQTLAELGKESNVSDLEWLYEAFAFGAAKTVEEASTLFAQELAENAKLFN